MTRLIIATTNPNKVREIEALLADVPAQLIGLGALPPVPEPEETGQTFQENARLKARYYAQAFGAPQSAPTLVVAEDSGLVVDALDGEPGVRSARFLGPDTPYSELIVPFVLAGVGMAMFFAPVANVVLSAVRPDEEGIASGANNAIRELGGVFGVAVLASVFAHQGGYQSGQAFVDGMNPAIMIGAGVVALGALAAFLIPGRKRAQEQPVEDLVPELEAA